MFGASSTGWFGTSGFLLSDFAVEQDPWVYAFWMFQVVFAATAATIVSGAMAERTKFSSYLMYTVFLTAIVYPVFGSWAWGSLYKGGGWLEGLGFIDFAGSTVVHSVGGWAALAGALVIGPRLGRYGKDGKPRAMPGHNLVFATLGVFLLWFGWFGFNAGSTTAADTDIALIAVNTNLAAAAGAVAAMVTAWIYLKKPDATMALNGALAGSRGHHRRLRQRHPRLVGHHRPHRRRDRGLLGALLRPDPHRRPVGAISVHGVCGAWGTLAAGLFNAEGTSLGIIGVQLVGIAGRLRVDVRRDVGLLQDRSRRPWACGCRPRKRSRVSTATSTATTPTLTTPSGPCPARRGREREAASDLEERRVAPMRSGGAPWPRRAAPLSHQIRLE